MSTEPIVRKSVPNFDSGLIKVPRRSWPRRIGRISLRAVGGVIGLVVLLIAFLHTPWGKSVVRGRIEAKLGAMVNGEVSLGSLDYGFMFGSIELGELEIRDASGKPAIRIGSIDVDLDRGSLLKGTPVLEQLAIAGVDVTVVKNADGSSNLTGLFKPSDRKPLKQITVGKLSVSGAATITKPDGSIIAIKDLAVAGSVDAKPASKAFVASIEHVGAQIDITAPAGNRHVAVSLDGIKFDRSLDAIDVDIEKLAVGALGIEKLGAHVKLDNGKPRGEQKITLGKARVDSKQLAQMIGKELLLDNVALDLSITGPENKLAIRGGVRTGGASLMIDGTADISKVIPSYELAIVGKGRTIDVLAPQPGKKLLDVQTDIRIDIKGAGVSPLDLDTEVMLAVGPTKVGAIALDGLAAKAYAKRGAYKLETLSARGVELELTASADVGADKSLTGRLQITGSPAKAMKVLAAAGIAVPKKAPAVDKVDLLVTAAGKLNGELAVELHPTKIPLAGGTVALVGAATLDNKKLRVATTKIALANLDLVALAQLAGRSAKAAGSLSGTVNITKTATSRDADYSLAIALRDKPLTITARGHAGADSATARADVIRRSDRAIIASLDAKLPLDAQGFQPNGPWKLAIDVANRQLAEIAALLPAHLRSKLPLGTVEIHAALGGSPAKPTGTITVAANAAALKSTPGRQKIAMRAELVPTAQGLSVKTTGSVALEAQSPLVTIDGKIAMPYSFIGKKPDIAALRAGLTVDAAIDIPERPLASLASLKAKLVDLGGTIGGRISVRGPAKAVALDAKIRWNGYRTAAGTHGQTTIAATGTPLALTATITHNHTLGIVADIDRSNKDRIAIHARMLAPESPLLPLLPAFLAAKLGSHELGKLRTNLDARLVLSKTATGMSLDEAIVTGGLDITRGAIAIPTTNRRYHDVTLAIAGEPNGIRIKKLSLRESDVEMRDRKIDISGLLSLDKARPKQLALTLAARDWLVFGGEKFGMADAPRATATFDIGVKVDLASPIIGVDATIHSLALRSPDRLERGHFTEKASVSGDVIYIDQHGKTGKLPVAPVVAVVAGVTPKKKRPMDIRIHIPKAIRLEQTPMDVMARGDITIAIRDDGTKIRGALEMERGNLNLFGRDHALVDGSLTFSEQYPQGHMALTFERQLPDVVMRDLSRKQGGARVSFNGSPSKPKTSLHGAANAALLEVMAMYNGGRPINVARPGLPASTTVQAPRGDQLFILTFMASNLPHLLFLDRINAWADPYQGAGSYGRIANMEAEKYTAGGTRMKAVVRPSTPGRSNTEVQVDRMIINNDRAAVGVGVRAGDRGGGGVGVFVEWSSKE